MELLFGVGLVFLIMKMGEMYTLNFVVPNMWNQNAHDITEFCSLNMDAWYYRISVACNIRVLGVFWRGESCANIDLAQLPIHQATDPAKHLAPIFRFNIVTNKATQFSNLKPSQSSNNTSRQMKAHRGKSIAAFISLGPNGKRY